MAKKINLESLQTNNAYLAEAKINVKMSLIMSFIEMDVVESARRHAEAYRYNDSIEVYDGDHIETWDSEIERYYCNECEGEIDDPVSHITEAHAEELALRIPSEYNRIVERNAKLIK